MSLRAFEQKGYYDEVFYSLTDSILADTEPTVVPVYPDYPITDVLKNYFVIQTRQGFGASNWLETSDAYVKSLPKHKRHMLRLYTHLGDNVVVEYMRDPAQYHTKERVQEAMDRMMTEKSILIGAQLLVENNDLQDNYFTDVGELTTLGNHMVKSYFRPILTEFREGNRARMEQYIRTFIADFRAILQEAPRPTESIIVFRGVRTDDIREPAYQRGFTSTTYSTDIARYYADKDKAADDSRYIYEVQILPDTPCIALESISVYSNEREILLDSEVFAVPNEDLFEKYFLNEKMFSPDFGYEHLVTPNMSQSYRSRFMTVSATEEPAPGSGGFLTTARKQAVAPVMKKAVMSKPAKTRRKSRTRSATIRRPMLRDEAPQSPLQIPAPIPASVRRAMSLVVPTGRKGLVLLGRRRGSRSGKGRTRKIRRGTPFPKSSRGSQHTYQQSIKGK
jgi:hypothetical protein